MTSNAGAVLKFASDTVLPSVSGSEKSGALVPNGNMVELVSAIWTNLRATTRNAKREKQFDKYPGHLSPSASPPTGHRSADFQACCIAGFQTRSISTS